MSVLIKGMEIPDKCGHCRFATAFECQVTKNFITTFNVRQADCPLTPVPPHGRLIDADAVFNNLERTGWYDNADRDIAEELVLDAPTIIGEEEAESCLF